MNLPKSTKRVKASKKRIMENKELKKAVSTVAQELYLAFHMTGKYCEQMDGSGGISLFVEESANVRIVNDRNGNYVGCVILRTTGTHTVYVDTVRREIYAADDTDFCRTGMKEGVWRELDECLED